MGQLVKEVIADHIASHESDGEKCAPHVWTNITEDFDLSESLAEALPDPPCGEELETQLLLCLAPAQVRLESRSLRGVA